MILLQKFSAHLFLLIVIAFSSLSCLNLQAQDISGSWTGTLELPGMELTLVFHLNKTDDGWTGTMDSPDQHATGIPASTVTFEAPELRIEIQNGLIEFEGEWKDDDSIEGTFRQSGMSFPLQLKKGAPETARSEEHTSELQSRGHLVCRLLLEKKK